MCRGSCCAEPWRWVALGVFVCFSVTSSIQWVTFAPIAAQSREFYNMTTSQLNWLYTMWMVVFVVGAYFTCATFETVGVRYGVIAGCAVSTLAGVLKLAPGLQRPSFASLMVPQTINSAAMLFMDGTPPVLAAQYFPPHQKAFVTSIASSAGSVGCAIALFLPTVIVRRGTRREFATLLGLELGLCAATLVAAVLLLRPPREPRTKPAPAAGSVSGGDHDSAPAATLPAPERPPDAAPCQYSPREREHEDECEAAVWEDSDACKTNAVPCTGGATVEARADGSASVAGNEEPGDDSSAPEAPAEAVSCCHRFRLWLRRNPQVRVIRDANVTMWALRKDRDFIFLFVSSSIGTGTVWAFAAILAQILEPFGLSTELCGIAGALNVVIGAVTAYVVGLWVDRVRRYRIPVVVSLVGSLLCVISLMVVMLKMAPHTNAFSGVVTFLYILAGVFQNCISPIAFDFAMELTYPLPESVPSLIMMVGANLMCLVLVTVASALLGDGVAAQRSCVYVVVMMAAVYAVGIAFAIPTRERRKRLAAELEHAAQPSSPSCCSSLHVERENEVCSRSSSTEGELRCTVVADATLH